MTPGASNRFAVRRSNIKLAGPARSVGQEFWNRTGGLGLLPRSFRHAW
jgi:hypothetical protein